MYKYIFFEPTAQHFSKLFSDSHVENQLLLPNCKAGSNTRENILDNDLIMYTIRKKSTSTSEMCVLRNDIQAQSVAVEMDLSNNGHLRRTTVMTEDFFR